MNKKKLEEEFLKSLKEKGIFHTFKCMLIKKEIRNKNILYLIASFLTFILEFETTYVIKSNINGWIGLSVIIFFILPIIFTHLLAQQYKNVGKGIIYEILKTLQKISLLSPILILLSFLIFVCAKQELIMLIIASISVILPIVIITADIFIVSCFDMYNKDKPKTV